MALVERSDQDGIAILSLNRPDTLNALSPALFVELRDHIDTIAGLTSRDIGLVVECLRFRLIEASMRRPGRRKHQRARIVTAMRKPRIVSALVADHHSTHVYRRGQ